MIRRSWGLDEDSVHQLDAEEVPAVCEMGDGEPGASTEAPRVTFSTLTVVGFQTSNDGSEQRVPRLKGAGGGTQQGYRPGAHWPLPKSFSISG